MTQVDAAKSAAGRFRCGKAESRDEQGRTTYMRWYCALAIAALLLAPVARSVAQTPRSAAQTPEADSRRDRMRTFLVLRISEALDLPEDKALQISKVLRAAEEKRRALVDQRREVEQKLRDALEQTSNWDPAAFTKLIAEANDLDGKIALIPESSFRQVQDLLTVEQQARLVLLRPELQAQIRRNMARRMNEKHDR